MAREVGNDSEASGKRPGLRRQESCGEPIKAARSPTDLRNETPRDTPRIFMPNMNDEINGSINSGSSFSCDPRQLDSVPREGSIFFLRWALEAMHSRVAQGSRRIEEASLAPCCPTYWGDHKSTCIQESINSARAAILLFIKKTRFDREAEKAYLHCRVSKFPTFGVASSVRLFKLFSDFFFLTLLLESATNIRNALNFP